MLPVSGFSGDPIYQVIEFANNNDTLLDQPLMEGSKHEAHCAGRSVMSVIEQNQDFKQLKNQINSPNILTFRPEFSFTRHEVCIFSFSVSLHGN